MNHYLITALPRLPELGGAPPLHPVALLDYVADRPRAAAAVRLLLLEEDLRQRDGFLSGELQTPTAWVLTTAQVRNEAPLPAELQVALTEDLGRPGSDLSAAARAAANKPFMNATWAAWFRHLAAQAEALPSRFLAGWVGNEVALRNALARVRAQALSVDVTDALVAPELGAPGPEHLALATQWVAVPNQLSALRLIDTARLEWIRANEPWFSFSDDELVAWAAKLLLVYRWHRLGPPPEARLQPSSTQGAPS